MKYLLSAAAAAAGFWVAESFVLHHPINKHTTTSTIALHAHDSLKEAGVNVAQQVQPSVALVTPMGVRKMKTRGSGFVVEFPPKNDAITNDDASDTEEYTYLITSAHVAAPGFEIGLSFQGEDTNFPATVMGRNQTLDLALLRISKEKKAPSPLSIASDLPPVGTVTYAHGYPASRLRGPAMTSGIVCGIADGLGVPDSDETSRTEAPHDGTVFVVTDAAMSGGMSGGPLTDAEGNVLGVNALIRPDLRALGNYAVSAEEVQSFLKDLASRENEVNGNSDAGKASPCEVLLFNDPMNKKARVSNLLKNVAELSEEDANRVMMQAHTNGSGVISTFDNRTRAYELCEALRKEDLLVEVQ